MLHELYRRYRTKMPVKIQSILTKLVFMLPNKPFVKKDDLSNDQKFPSEFKGGLIISADFELGWAFRYSKTDPFPEINAKQARENFPFLLKSFENYHIPVTWATVGHLFLSSCKKGDHDLMHRIPYFKNRNWRYDKGDWFDCDPYSSWEQANYWYAPDLIEKIMNSKVKHEIGCHTFSHVDFSDENCPPEVADDEIKACIDAANKWGLSLKSIVFPGGTYGNVNILKKYGFKIYRKNVNYDLAYPYQDQAGLLVSPTTTSFGNNNFGWSISYFINRYKKFIDTSIKKGKICHIWFHPSMDIWFLKNVFSSVLTYASQKRDEGKLWIGTMGQIADHIHNMNILN